MFCRWKWSLWVVPLLALLIVGCKTRGKVQRRGVASKDILAEVGDSIITKKDLQNALQQMSPYVRNQYNSFARRKALLMQLVQFEVLWQEAKQKKLEQSSEVTRLRRKVMVQTLIRRTVQKVRPVDISESSIKAYYKANKASFQKPLQQVQDKIRLVLLQQKRKVLFQQLLDSLKSKYTVTINKDLLATIPTLPTKREPATRTKPTPGRVKAKTMPAQRAPVARQSSTLSNTRQPPTSQPSGRRPNSVQPITVPHPPVIRNPASKPQSPPSTQPIK